MYFNFFYSINLIYFSLKKITIFSSRIKQEKTIKNKEKNFRKQEKRENIIVNFKLFVCIIKIKNLLFFNLFFFE